MARPATNLTLARSLFRHGAIKRTLELREAGVHPATLTRMEADGEILRLGRGLYQLSGAQITAEHDLAEAALRAPTGVICLVSALAFHGLTDRLPSKVWIAIGAKDHAPPPRYRLKIVRFNDRLLTQGVECHTIEGVPVRVFDVTKTIADCFRHRSAVGLNLALEGMETALRERKTTPAKLAKAFAEGRVATVARPYLEALAAHG